MQTDRPRLRDRANWRTALAEAKAQLPWVDEVSWARVGALTDVFQQELDAQLLCDLLVAVSGPNSLAKGSRKPSRSG